MLKKRTLLVIALLDVEFCDSESCLLALYWFFGLRAPPWLKSPADDAERRGSLSLIGSWVVAVSLDRRFERCAGEVVGWEGDEVGYAFRVCDCNGRLYIVRGVHAVELSYMTLSEQLHATSSSRVSGTVSQHFSLGGAAVVDRVLSGRYKGVGLRKRSESPYEIRCSVFSKQYRLGAFSSEKGAALAYDFVMRALMEDGAQKRPLNFAAGRPMDAEERGEADRCLATIWGKLEQRVAEGGQCPDNLQTSVGPIALPRYVGVCEDRSCGYVRYRARITVARHVYDLGSYATAVEAAAAHDYVGRRCGSVRRMNFPHHTSLRLTVDAVERLDHVLTTMTLGEKSPADDAKSATFDEIFREFRESTTIRARCMCAVLVAGLG